MTDNIITPQFGKKPEDEIVFICGCGCKSFYLHQSGTIECASCWERKYDLPESGKWVEQLPNTPVQGDDAGAVSTIATGDVNFARRRVLKHINENMNDLACIFAYFEDGSGKHWTGITNQQEKEWVLRKIEAIKQMIEATAT